MQREVVSCCVGLFSLLLLAIAVQGSTSGGFTVYYNQTTNTYTLQPGLDVSAGACWGSFDDSLLNETGWATTDLSTSAQFSDEIQNTAAGYFEGATSHALIYSLHEMFNALYPNTSSLNIQITQWFDTHIQWVESQLSQKQAERKNSSPPDPYWETVGLLMAQLRGLVAGYNEYAAPGQGLSFTQLFMLNSGGDLMDVMMSLDPSTRSSLFLDHCSALILPLFDDSSNLVDILTGHTTWNQYNSMLRIFKHYNFNSASSPPFWHSFSSYPSFLFSGDDYYITSGGLAVIETTFTIFNNDLYKYVKPTDCLLTWMRAMIANRLASSGAEWASLFSQYNSGTYNNQWMIVDYKLFDGTLRDNMLWVVEQIPGNVQSADMTSTLRAQGYWPSYNIPFFKTIYNQSGYAAVAAQNGGEQYVYNSSARANIFRRDYSKVNNMEDMKSLMQYNDWQNDPLSLGSPANSISSRFDLLNSTDAQLMGGIDSKVTNVELFKLRQTWAISGPTYQQQPVFSWSDWESSPHFGQPEQFEFDWVVL